MGFLVLLPFLRTTDLQRALRSKQLDTPWAEAAIQNHRQQRIRNSTLEEISARSTDTEYKIIILDDAKSTFESYVEQRLFQVSGQFNRSASPYPGTISKDTSCLPDSRPHLEPITGNGWRGYFLKTFANSRKLLGICTEDEKAFNAGLLFLLCENSGRAFDFTVFSPLTDSSAIESLKSVSCMGSK